MGAADSGITGISLYTIAAERAAGEVIDTYSTSFGAAARLLGKRVRQDVRNIYALVRVADEIVDGAASQALGVSEAATGSDAALNERMLDELEAETYAAIDRGYSTNLIVHAFAHTALKVGIGRELIEPFFTSMRMDLHQHEHDAESLETYIYGSAEVVGLMCLQAFVHGQKYTADEHTKMIEGARALGSAFQKVNFLRDLAADLQQLGRSYFPGVNAKTFDEQTKRRLVAEIEGELAISARSLPLLPADSKPAVAAAQLLFEALNHRIANTEAAVVATTRISVGNFSKLGLLVRAYLGIFPKP